MPADKTFKNERLTYKLTIVAEQAIVANDQIFLKATGCRIRDLRVLIERANSNHDARVFLLSTTAKGKEIRHLARQVSDQLEVILTDPLSAHELRSLNEILERLGSWVSSEEYQVVLENALK